MATFIRRIGKWEVRVKRYNNKTISKIFTIIEDAMSCTRNAQNKSYKGIFKNIKRLIINLKYFIYI